MRFLVKLFALATVAALAWAVIVLIELLSGSISFTRFAVQELVAVVVLVIVGSIGQRLWFAIGAPEPDDW